MGFITNITTADPTTGSYINGMPANIANDMGSVRGGGTIVDTDDWSSSALGEGNPVITIVSGVGAVEGAVPGAFNQGTQVVNAAQNTIAGTANTALQGGQSNSANVAYTPLQETAVRTYFYKTAVVAGNWNVFTGAFSSITNVVSGVWDIAAETDDAADMRTAGTDIAANTTSDIPGRMTYRDGSPNPIQSGYGPRYNW